MYEYIEINNEPEVKEDEIKIKKIVPDNFLGLIIGSTGAGKTRLISKLLSNDKVWGNLHEKIIYCTPTEKPDFKNTNFKDKLEFLDVFDIDTIMARIKSIDQEIKEDTIDDQDHIDILDRFSKKKTFAGNFKLKNILQNKMDENKKSSVKEFDLIDSIDFFKTNDTKMGGKRFVLLILDDCVTDISRNKYDDSVAKMFFNRRWQGTNFVLNILISTQKLSWVPNFARSQATFYISFIQTYQDMSFFKKELSLSSKFFEDRCYSHWKERKHNFIYVYDNNVFGNFSKKLDI